MRPTTTGENRTGTAVHPAGLEQMLEAVQELSPEIPISTASIDAERLKYIMEADSVGSVPPAMNQKGARMGADAMSGVEPSLLLDKIGERIAFERAGTRLYDALIAKYIALSETAGDILPSLDELDEAAALDGEVSLSADGELPLQTLQRIRAEELGHSQMLCQVMRQLGGDPTAQTPCADVAGTAGMGLMQVVTDPRTTLAQCLQAVLCAELTDNVSWELLAELAEMAGQDELVEQFGGAIATEAEHAATVQAWLRALTLQSAGTEAV